jgi:hypothetical protein
VTNSIKVKIRMIWKRSKEIIILKMRRKIALMNLFKKFRTVKLKHYWRNYKD